MRPSRRLALAIGAIHLGATIFVWLLPWPLWLSAVLTLALVAHAVYAIAVHALRRSPDAIAMLRVGDDLAWRQNDVDEWRAVRIKSLFVHPLAVVLLAKAPASRARSVVILPDSLDADTFSLLRARLNQLRLKPKSNAMHDEIAD